MFKSVLVSVTSLMFTLAMSQLVNAADVSAEPATLSSSQNATSNTSQSNSQDIDTFAIKLPAKDGFELAARYYPGKKFADGMIVLHDCKSESALYDDIGQRLNKQGYHALVLDLRSFGNSVSKEVSHRDIKKRAKDIVLYQQMLGLITAYWEGDVLAAYEYFRTKLDKKAAISFVASGCSAPYAVTTAEKLHVANMVLITPEMDFSVKERYKNLNDIPTYFVDSIYSIETHQTSKELFEWNGHARSNISLFKGDVTDAALLKRNRSLVPYIVMWLSERNRAQ